MVPSLPCRPTMATPSRWTWIEKDVCSFGEKDHPSGTDRDLDEWFNLLTIHNEIFATEPAAAYLVHRSRKHASLSISLLVCVSIYITRIGQMVADLHMLNAGEVYISVPSVLLTLYFPDIITTFSSRFPNIKIFVRENPSKLVIENIMDGEADIGFVMLPTDLHHLNSQVIISDVCSTVLPKDSELAWEDALKLQDLENRKIATFTHNATLHDIFIQECNKLQFEPNIIYKSMSIDFLMDIISSTGCIGVLPSPVIKHYIKDTLKEIPLIPAIPWDIALVFDNNRYKSHACMKFISFIQEYFGCMCDN